MTESFISTSEFEVASNAVNNILGQPVEEIEITDILPPLNDITDSNKVFIRSWPCWGSGKRSSPRSWARARKRRIGRSKRRLWTPCPELFPCNLKSRHAGEWPGLRPEGVPQGAGALCDLGLLRRRTRQAAIRVGALRHGPGRAGAGPFGAGGELPAAVFRQGGVGGGARPLQVLLHPAACGHRYVPQTVPQRPGRDRKL